MTVQDGPPDPDMVPGHVAIIMDGNGRWATQRGLPRARGHKQGVEAVRETVEGCMEAGVKTLTLFAFSTENWSRPKEEVRDLMGLLRLYLRSEISKLHKERVRLRVIGHRDSLDKDINVLIDAAETKTAANDRLTLVVALNYGGRTEIVDAARALVQAIVEGRESIENIDENRFSSELSLHDAGDPDMIIRTSGEYRLSNFLLWQSAYSELVFVDTLWPDFTRQHLWECFQSFGQRERRFGGRVGP